MINIQNKKVSVVMPCLNEELTIGSCIEKVSRAFNKHNIDGEIVIADNGSTDKSVEIAKKLGVRVVHEPKQGYGNAYHKGIEEAIGEYIVIGDSDNTYDFSKINDFLEPLSQKYDFVIGNRFAYKLEKGAMPFLHKYVGNPILSAILRKMFNVKVRDAHCGMRSFTKEAYEKLDLHTSGMEYASEMIIKAGKKNLKIKEIPILYYIREGESKLNTFSDGWRHLRFMLLYSPTYLFLIPGLILFIFGIALLSIMMFGSIKIGGLIIDLHPMFLGSLAAILGYQIIIIGFFTKVYAVKSGLENNGKITKWISRYFTLEKGLTLGIFFLIIGLLLFVWVVWEWKKTNFGALYEIRKTLSSLTLIVLGAQTMFSAFFLSILNIPTRRK